ncbi:TIGR00266 family protein [Limnoraphis robusta]|uniref:TIGR00266 family protein n=1 Tax=Limnoraphis robusta CCNP1315 TaxID=3110306 RepID=A0ABU5TZ04_9CYAN|nr:TIGR00266 family protein [Limnoraphis robusta]MEA5520130.1 TIGR00266 family protein [Limnoraphis robusta CCNP1315]MEA5543900.1 TIGR00266 family protein [Limnoraphis robusta CCNP1324]
MEYQIRYKPAFATIFMTLQPGDSLTAEAGAMVGMDGQISMKTSFSGGFFSGLIKKFLGGESLFVNTFTNKTNQPLQVVLSQSAIGDIVAVELHSGQQLCFQPGAYIASSKKVKLGVGWAGFASWFAREGLFKLKVTGPGLVFFGAYGGISQKQITQEFIVDNSHLVAYEPGIKMSVGLAGGLFGSLTSGEGFINKLRGNGVVYLQSRSINGLVRFLSPKYR